MNNRHPLGQLIRSIQEAEGWSDRDLEARAVGKQGLGKSNLSKIKNHPISALKGSVIKGLSELLQVPESLIAKAALESMDISLSSPPAKTLEDAVRNEPELTAKERRILLAVVSEMRSDKEVVGNGDHPTHIAADDQAPVTQLQSRRPATVPADEPLQRVARKLHPGDIAKDNPSGDPHDREG